MMVTTTASCQIRLYDIYDQYDQWCKRRFTCATRGREPFLTQTSPPSPQMLFSRRLRRLTMKNRINAFTGFHFYLCVYVYCTLYDACTHTVGTCLCIMLFYSSAAGGTLLFIQSSITQIMGRNYLLYSILILL